MTDPTTGLRTMQAEPYEFQFEPRSTALVIIDMQRDFVEPGGFGEALGNDVTPLQKVIEPCRRMLDAARTIGMMVIHTREGHRPDLADCPPTKIARGRGATRRHRAQVPAGCGRHERHHLAGLWRASADGEQPHGRRPPAEPPRGAARAELTTDE